VAVIWKTNKGPEVDTKWVLGKWFCGGSEDGSLSTPEASFFVSILKPLGSINTKGVAKHNLKISRHL
jgi:hypothetical protein